MSGLTPELLSEQNLRHFAGNSGFSNGMHYYWQRRVELIRLDEDTAHLHVTGTQQYCVDIEEETGNLYAECTCPHGQRGNFCKHIVAAGLYLRDYLRAHGASMWRGVLDNALRAAESAGTRARSAPYLLFFSLQSNYGYWGIQPLTLASNVLPETGWTPEDPHAFAAVLEIIEHNPWMAERVKAPRQSLDASACLNSSPDLVAVANLILRSEGFNTGYYYSYNRPLQEYLALLANFNAPLFTGPLTRPLEQALTLYKDDATLELEMTSANGDGVILQTTLRVGDTIIPLERGKIQILIRNPTWILADHALLKLSEDIPADMANTFLNTPRLAIPKKGEGDFLEKYLINLANKIPVTGTHIQWEELTAVPIKRLYLSEKEGELLVNLRFGYGDYEVVYQKPAPALSVQRKPNVENNATSETTWTLLRIHRDAAREDEIYSSVSSTRSGLKYGSYPHPADMFLLRSKVSPLDFLLRKVPMLVEDGFEIFGEDTLKSARVNRNRPTISLNVTSGIDWFDVLAVIKFGEVEASLQEVRRALRKKERFIKLADGTIGEIPEEWLQKYRHLFGLGEQTDEGVRLSEHHLTLLDQLLEDADRAQADDQYRQRLQRLTQFDGIATQTLPTTFTGELRPYQKAGFDWLYFLHDYKFGGCLADDMGLGKTVQVLAFLQSLREKNQIEKADLIVVPRSLLINWEREAARFTPNLRVHHHFGLGRDKESPNFDEFDLVLTTYGTLLRDVQTLRMYKFHYVVLDESQAIKNPAAQTSKAVRLLNSAHRLVMTGTPVENNTFELWSQFAFLNPGLLGNLEYFKEEFSGPIERRKDDETANFLKKIVFPFILRRTKDQVAPELPPRTERILYADMEPAQQKLYNKTRDYYRALLMGMIEEEGMNNARMKVLEGLLRLRQISNHPKLVEKDFRGDSAKMEMLMEHLETLEAEGHKALIFSQFVEMLKIIRGELDKRKIKYNYLDGRTRKRQEQVDEFQTDPTIPFFLISLKAGGVGLNLTAADYVIHVDPWWNPAVEMQATDRTHRIGQDKPVFVYKLIARDTVEEKILQLQDQKRALVEQLISTEASFFKELTTDDIQVLFS
ncbi:MAG: SNF2 helicase associated domain-containing protein [Anaerolineales bacterium]|nr:SNF2 helicase associated domain-containing protein [Anaerolineales bacterium]